jgi:hypothetical protein
MILAIPSRRYFYKKILRIQYNRRCAKKQAGCEKILPVCQTRVLPKTVAAIGRG